MTPGTVGCFYLFSVTVDNIAIKVCSNLCCNICRILITILPFVIIDILRQGLDL